MIHELRVIPLGAAPPLDDAVRLLSGARAQGE